MAKKIYKRPEFKETLAAWKLGSSFEKGVELGFDSPYGVTGWGEHFVIVQKGKLVADTDGIVSISKKNNKTKVKFKKLNRLYFPKLKCSLLSKKVKADVYSVATDIYTYQTINCTKSQYNVSVAYQMHLKIKDAAEICERLLVKTNSSYYTQKSLISVVEALAKQACEKIIPTLSFAPCRLTVNKTATSKEAVEFAEKFKAYLKLDLAAIGYELIFS